MHASRGIAMNYWAVSLSAAKTALCPVPHERHGRSILLANCTRLPVAAAMPSAALRPF